MENETMLPEFKHDCDQCEFLGNFFDHDVYICTYKGNVVLDYGSIIARYGDEGHEYASMPLFALLDGLQDSKHRIGLSGGRSMNYRDWIFSNERVPSTSAMILALAIKGIDSVKTTHNQN